MAASKPEVIVDSNRSKAVVAELLKRDVIAMDAEGVNLGREGPLTLLQLGTADHQVYLFDIQKNKRLFTDGKLQDLLTSPDITKVIHSCSGDSAALYHQFSIRLQCVFDTQVCHLVIEENKGRAFPSLLKLETICEHYSATAKVAEQKTSLKEKWTTESGNLWAQRPLTQDMIQYAAGDVTALLPEVYETQKRYIEDHNLREQLNERVEEEITISFDQNMAKQRHDRVNDTVQHVMKKFNDSCGSSTRYSNITDEDVLNALKRIDAEAAKEISPTIDRLKTECIMAELDDIDKTLRGSVEEIIKTRIDRSLARFEKHQDKHISDKAKQLQEINREVLVRLMTKKYDIGTPLANISAPERETLKRLRPKSTNDPDFSPVVLDLYWKLMESNLEFTASTFASQGRTFTMHEGHYKKIRFFMHPNTQVPDRLKRRAKEFVKSLDKTFGRNVIPK